MDDGQQSNTHPAKRPRRSGSERRQRGGTITFRVLPSERLLVEAYAEASEQTVSTYVRSRVLAAPETRARPRPRVEVKALARLLSELHKIGSNVNQIARHMNMLNLPEEGEVLAARADIQRGVDALLAVLDRSPEEEHAA